MRQRSLYDPNARKKTVSITVNSDLWDRAKALGLNLSEVAETAIAAAFVAKEKARIQAEIDQEMLAYNEIVERYGSFAELARAHYAAKDADEAV